MSEAGSADSTDPQQLEDRGHLAALAAAAAAARDAAEPPNASELAEAAATAVWALNGAVVTVGGPALQYPSHAEGAVRWLGVLVGRLPRTFSNVTLFLEHEQASGRISIEEGSPEAADRVVLPLPAGTPSAGDQARSTAGSSPRR